MINCKKAEKLLSTPYQCENFCLQNRVCFQPMEGCDGTEEGAPSELTENKYLSYAKGGAALIWFEATATVPEGRANPRQLYICEKTYASFALLVEKIKETCLRENGYEPKIICQLTHSGRQSVKPMIAYRHPIYEEQRPANDGMIVKDEYLDTLPEKYAEAAKLAKKAGFDGMDVKSCHGYLFQELLSAFSRPGRYGGSFENRTKLYIDSVKAVKSALSGDSILATRLSVSDMLPYPYGFGTDAENNLDFTEPDKLIELLQNEGISLLNVTIGNPYYNPHVNRPYRKGAYNAPEPAEVGLARFVTAEKHIKEKFRNLTIVGSGISYYRENLIEKAEEQITLGICDIIGFGRASLAYPMLYKDYLFNSFDYKKCCLACSKCTLLMRQGCVSGCAVFNEYYRNLLKTIEM